MSGELRVLRKDAVEQAAKRLMEARVYNPGKPGIYSPFTGYLAALYAHADGETVTKSKMTEFLDRFFKPSNGTKERPWWVPWVRTKTRWYNKDAPAGSFAASSVRVASSKETEILAQVLHPPNKDDNEGWRLKDDHANLALESLLGGEKLDVVDLATFMLRDFGFRPDEANKAGLVNALRHALGIADDHETFGILFDSSRNLGESDWEVLSQ